jgi:hypothetical protein
MDYVLYNISQPIFNIINYLSYRGYNLEPIYIDNKSDNICPIITTESNEIYIGEKKCIEFYTNQSCIIHLNDKSREFNEHSNSLHVKTNFNYCNKNIKIKID